VTRRRRYFLVSLSVVTAVWVGAGLLLTARLDALLNREKDAELPALSERLGRPVRIGRITTTLFSGFGVTVDDIAIGADPTTPADALPLASIARVRVRVSLLSALFSFGRRVHINELRIDAPVVNLVRLPDGTLNGERLAAKLAATAPPGPSPPMSERTRATIEHARVREARLVDGRVHFVDLKDLAAPVEISSLGLTLRDVSLQSSWTAELTAAVLSSTKNLELRTRFGAARDLEHLPPPVEAVRLKLARTDLLPLAPFLAHAVAGLAAAAVTADLDADLGALAPGGSGLTKLEGSLVLGGVRFAGGTPFDAALDSDVAGDFGGGQLDVRKLLVTVAGMALSGHGRLRDLDKQPRFEDFAIETRAVDFDELRRLYPALDRAAGLVLHGPASARVVASGSAAAQTFDVDVDLTAAALQKPRLFDKPRGTPLELRARGRLDGDVLKVDTLALRLADLNLAGGGTVRRLAHPTVDLRVGASLANLAGLLRLLPSVAAQLPAGAAVAGAFVVQAQASGGPGDIEARAEVSLRGANLALPSVRLLGGAHIVAEASAHGRDASVHIDANLAPLEAFYEDLLHKPAQLPLSLTLDARRAGARLSPTLELQLASLRAHAEGTIDGETRPVADLTLRIDGLSVDALTALLPSLATSGMPPIALSATAHVQGRSDRPETLRAEVRDLRLTSRKSNLTGELTVNDLVRPQIELSARSTYLDTADILPKPASTAAKPAPGGETSRQPAMLAGARGHAVVTVARGIASGVPFESLQADLELRDGRVRATKLEVGAWGGHFSGSGSEFELVDDKGPFRLVGKITQVDVAELLARFGDSHDLLRGKLSADVDTRGRGTSAADLQRTLEGSLGGSVADAQLTAASLGGAVAQKLAAQLPLGATGPKLAGGTNLRTLAGQVQFVAGAMHLSKPMTADTPDGPLALNGRVFLDGRLDLTGTFTLSPQAASALLGHSVKLSGPLPLSLRLGGDLRHPSLDLANLGEVARLLAASLAAAGVQGKANELLKKSGLAGKVPGLDATKLPTSEADARAQAEAAAKAAQAEAQRRAEAAAAEAQRQAEEAARQRADDARKQLEKQAEDRLKGLFGH
jgi:AsmA protein